MDWFSVHVRASAPADVPQTTPDEAATGKLMDLLEGFHGIVSAGAGLWDATISFQAPSLHFAADHGAALIQGRASTAGMPGWPFTRIETAWQDEPVASAPGG
jgi:hypothetical protein